MTRSELTLLTLALAGLAWSWLADSRAPEAVDRRGLSPEVRAEDPREEPATEVDPTSRTYLNAEDVRALLRRTRAAGPEEIPSLRRQALEDPDPLTAGNTLRALGRFGVVTAESDLEGLVHDTRPRVRQEAVVALGASGDPGSVPILVEVLDGDDAALAPLALRAVGSIGGEAARRELQRRAGDPAADERQRAHARSALARVQ